LTRDLGWWQLVWDFLTAHGRFAPNQSFDCIPQVIFGEVGVTQGRFNSLVAHDIYAYYVFRRSEMRTMASGASQDLCSPLEGIGQHCALPRIELTGVVLDPSLPVAA
jgi:hypothetical protein